MAKKKKLTALYQLEKALEEIDLADDWVEDVHLGLNEEEVFNLFAARLWDLKALNWDQLPFYQRVQVCKNRAVLIVVDDGKWRHLRVVDRHDPHYPAATRQFRRRKKK